MRGTGRSDQAKGGPRVRFPVVLAGVVAAVLLSFSLAASAQTGPRAGTPVLEQLVNGTVRCVSGGAACTDVDLFGDEGRRPGPIQQGGQRTTSVLLRNSGTVDASTLDVAPGLCRDEEVSPGTIRGNLCATATVKLACLSARGDETFAWGPQTLASFAQLGPHTVASGLAPGDGAACRFTVAYPLDAPRPTEAQLAVQPITWTLTAPETAVSPGEVVGPSAPGAGTLPVTGSPVPVLVLAALALLIVGTALSGAIVRAYGGATAGVSRAARAVPVRRRR